MQANEAVCKERRFKLDAVKLSCIIAAHNYRPMVNRLLEEARCKIIMDFDGTPTFATDISVCQTTDMFSWRTAILTGKARVTPELAQPLVARAISRSALTARGGIFLR
jgi:hypothetical protein